MSEAPKIDGLPTALIQRSIGMQMDAVGAAMRNDQWAGATPRQLELLKLFLTLPVMKQRILLDGARGTGMIPARVIEHEASLKDKMGSLDDTTKSDFA